MHFSYWPRHHLVEIFPYQIFWIIAQDMLYLFISVYYASFLERCRTDHDDSGASVLSEEILLILSSVCVVIRVLQLLISTRAFLGYLLTVDTASLFK